MAVGNEDDEDDEDDEPCGHQKEEKHSCPIVWRWFLLLLLLLPSDDVLDLSFVFYHSFRRQVAWPSIDPDQVNLVQPTNGPSNKSTGLLHYDTHTRRSLKYVEEQEMSTKDSSSSRSSSYRRYTVYIGKKRSKMKEIQTFKVFREKSEIRSQSEATAQEISRLFFSLFPAAGHLFSSPFPFFSRHFKRKEKNERNKIVFSQRLLLLGRRFPLFPRCRRSSTTDERKEKNSSVD